MTDVRNGSQPNELQPGGNANTDNDATMHSNKMRAESMGSELAIN